MCLSLLILAVLNFLPVPDQSKLASPLLNLPKLKNADNIWTPEFKLIGISVAHAAPAITGRAAFFVDINTGQVLFDKNAKERLPIASLTKIMTVIVALENSQDGSYKDRVFTISSQAAQTEPDKMELIAGEKLSLEELLDGIFLVSANDAAEQLAEDTTGRREEFINLMNSKAKQLGMNDTLFINPTGLEEDNTNQYSSAYDVALMSRYAIKKYPHLIEITSEPHIFLPATATHQDYDLYSGINLLTTYPGVLGFKTGYTPEAGLTLVTLASRGGHEVLGVLLGCENRRDDAKLLLDYSFEQLGIK